MKSKLSIIVTIWFLACPSLALADLPKIIKSGFETYKNSGLEAAVERWGTNWDDKSKRKIVNGLREFELTKGGYEGYELHREVSIGPRASIFFVLVYYEKSLLFSKFHSYKKASGDVTILRINFESKIEKGWPPSLIYDGL